MARRGGFPGGGMPGNMNNLMKQAQKMQRQMEEKTKEIDRVKLLNFSKAAYGILRGVLEMEAKNVIGI